MSSRGVSRLTWVALVFVAISCVWFFTAWLARDVRPQAIEWTDVAFAVCLGATYVGLWTAAMIWSRKRRTMLLRAISATGVLFTLVLILETAAFAGLVNYEHVFRLLTGTWVGPDTHFVEDVDLGYRRPPNTKWSGRPQSDMAKLWNLPIRAPRQMTLTMDSKGFRNPRELDRADVVLIGDSYVGRLPRL